MADTKRYVDQAGLKVFLDELKGKYATNTADNFKVNHAIEADKLATARKITITNSNITGVTPIAYDFDGTAAITFDIKDLTSGVNALTGVKIDGTLQTVEDHVAILNLEAYAKKTDIPKAFIYKGPKKGSELRALKAADVENGWIYSCTEDDLTAEPKFHAGYEYLVHKEESTFEWVELGKWIDCYTKAETDAKIEEAKAYADTAVAAEATVRYQADNAEVNARNIAIDNAFNLDLHVVPEHDIRKMFGSTATYEQPTGTVEAQAADLKNKIQAVESGNTIAINQAVVADCTEANRGIKLGAGYDGTIDLSNGGVITAGTPAGKTAADARVLHLEEGAVLEIIGGEVKNASDGNPAVTVFGASSLILNGTKIENDGAQTSLSSLGANVDTSIIIKNATIVGSCYFPACGSLLIEDSIIKANANTAADGCGVYIKAGHATIKNCKREGGIQGATVVKPANSVWKHSENGFNGPACGIIIENCNYGLKGNVTVNIDNVTATPGVTDGDFDPVGILVINYNGNKGVCNINQEYWVADVTDADPMNPKTFVFCKTAKELPGKNVVVMERIN